MAVTSVEIAVCVRLACLLHQSIPWLVCRTSLLCGCPFLSVPVPVPAPVNFGHAFAVAAGRPGTFALARQFHPNDGCLDSLYLDRPAKLYFISCTSPTDQMRDKARLGSSHSRFLHCALCVCRLRDPSSCGEKSIQSSTVDAWENWGSLRNPQSGASSASIASSLTHELDLDGTLTILQQRRVDPRVY